MHSTVVESEEKVWICMKQNPPLHMLEAVLGIAALIVEGRVPSSDCKHGYFEGPHYLSYPPTYSNRRKIDVHRCDLRNNPFCIQMNGFCQKMKLLWEEYGKLYIEIVVSPDCVCGSKQVLCNSTTSDYVLEQWCIAATGGCKDSLEQNSRVSWHSLLQAVRSQLHFSQLCAWWSSNNGRAPKHLCYRILSNQSEMCASTSVVMGDADGWIEHTFPLLSLGASKSRYLQVQLKCPPRTDKLPNIYCSLHSDSKVIDDRELVCCNRQGKHRCEDAADKYEVESGRSLEVDISGQAAQQSTDDGIGLVVDLSSKCRCKSVGVSSSSDRSESTMCDETSTADSSVGKQQQPIKMRLNLIVEHHQKQQQQQEQKDGIYDENMSVSSSKIVDRLDVDERTVESPEDYCLIKSRNKNADDHIVRNISANNSTTDDGGRSRYADLCNTDDIKCSNVTASYSSNRTSEITAKDNRYQIFTTVSSSTTTTTTSSICTITNAIATTTIDASGKCFESELSDSIDKIQRETITVQEVDDDGQTHIDLIGVSEKDIILRDSIINFTVLSDPDLIHNVPPTVTADEMFRSKTYEDETNSINSKISHAKEFNKSAKKCSKSRSLYGNFLECVLNERFVVQQLVTGFKCRLEIPINNLLEEWNTIPFVIIYYSFGDLENQNSYLAKPQIWPTNCDAVPKTGNFQVTLLNDLNSVIHVFFIKYDLRKMKANSSALIRQRIFYKPAIEPDNPQKYLKYVVNLKFGSTKCGHVFISDLRIIVLHKVDTVIATDLQDRTGYVMFPLTETSL